MRPQVGQVINNKYRILRLIGDGGMGSVYEARHEVLGSTVALKFLHSELARRSGLVQRFLQEARVSAKIQSPHVVRVTDVDQASNGLAFIVLEYLEGKTLQTLYEDLYRAGQRLTYADALEFAMQMLEGVDAAHQAGIVHRDLKPDNVMITRTAKGEALLKLLDFGIAKLKVTGELDKGLTRPGVVMGTPEYMAPEQAYSADTVDARADIFSLGIMIFEMLAGRRPVGGDDPQQIASAYLTGRVSRLVDLLPGVSPELAAAVHRAMAPLAKDRFATVAEMRAAIEPFALAVRPPQASRSSLSGSGPHAGSSPGLSLVTPGAPAAQAQAMSPVPPPTNAGGSGQGPVAKTYPPEARGPAASASAPLHAQEVFTGNDVMPEGANMSATVQAKPLLAGAGFGTVMAAPIELGQPAPPPRPGGTALGSFSVGGASSTVTGGTAPPGTGAMYTPPFAGVAAAPTGRRGRSGASALLLILLLASGVGAAVVGGLYFAHEYANKDDKADDPPSRSSSVTPPTPPTSDDPPGPVPTSPVPPPPPASSIHPGPLHPPGPRPLPSGPVPVPSTHPSGPVPVPSTHPSTAPPPAAFPGCPPGTTLPFPLCVTPLQPPPNPNTPPAPSNPGPAPSASQRHPGLIPIPIIQVPK